MDFEEIIQRITDFYQTNTAVAVAVTVIALFLLFRKPKVLFYLILFAAIVVGMKIIFAKITTTGLEHKKVPFLD